MFLGIFLAAGVSMYAVNNPTKSPNEASAENKGDTASFDPEKFYQESCASCHGTKYEGGMAPSLMGIHKHLSSAQIEGVLTNGNDVMPKGLVPQEHMQKMIEFVEGL